MPWGRIDDTLYDHPKVDALPAGIRLACMGLDMLAISWSNRFLTDGFVPDERIRKLGGKPAHKAALIAVELWETAEGGVIIHDFHVYNPTREGVMAEREAARQRMKASRRSGNVRPNTGRTSGEVPEKFGLGSATPARDAPASARASRPDPSESSPDPAERGGQVNPRANGTNPRALGTNPRAVANRDRKAKADGKQQVELAYYRGELTETQRDDALRELGYTIADPATWFDAPASTEIPT